MQVIKYKLLDVECWLYDGKNLPKLLPRKGFVDFIDSSFSKDQFVEIENSIKNSLEKSDYFIYSIMNPLYLNSESTVISFDIVKDKSLFAEKKFSRPRSKIGMEINNLLSKYEKRLNDIFSQGKGSTERFRKNNLLFSKDKELYNIEKQISQIATKNILHITDNIINNNALIWLQSLQWSEKNQDVIDIYLEKLKNANEQEINNILLQLIPVINTLPDDCKERIYNTILNNVLIFPSSSVRNKALSILSEIPEYISANKHFLNFLKIQAKSLQLNCSYPAKEILESLNRDD